jgi:hypothetical protein
MPSLFHAGVFLFDRSGCLTAIVNDPCESCYRPILIDTLVQTQKECTGSCVATEFSSGGIPGPEENVRDLEKLQPNNPYRIGSLFSCGA